MRRVHVQNGPAAEVVGEAGVGAIVSNLRHKETIQPIAWCRS